MVRINKKIKTAVSFNPTKKSHQLSILDMCKYIKKNKITLPLYQRDLSWNVKKSIALLNYQLFGKAPVAPISFNQMSTSKNSVPQVSFINREIIDMSQIEADHQSVVDGQQRLSTNYKAYTNHEDFRNIFLDVATAKFKIVNGSIKDYHVPVGVILNEDDDVLLEHLQEKKMVQELFPILTQIRSKLMSYNYTINVADNLTEDEQIEWFVALNNAGSRVSALQMSFSKLKLHDFDIYSDYVIPFKEKIQAFGYDELFSPFTTNVSYPVASLNSAFEKIKRNGQHNSNYAPFPSDTKETQITKLDIDDLKKVIALSLEGLDRSLLFLQSNDLEEFIDRMDYILYLVGYFIFNDVLEPEIEKKLITWVETIDFNNKSNGERRNIFDKLISNTFI